MGAYRDKETGRDDVLARQVGTGEGIAPWLLMRGLIEPSPIGDASDWVVIAPEAGRWALIGVLTDDEFADRYVQSAAPK